MPVLRHFLLLAGALFCWTACSSSEAPKGSATSGGNTGGQGNAGGNTAAGGAGAEGGTRATGGTGATGGTPSSGGDTGAGGSAGSATGGSGSGGEGGSTGGTGGEPPWDGVCPDNGGPTMVKLPEGFCIDSTEVTRAQYFAWLETNPDPTSVQQSDLCADNTSFEPDATCFEGACQGDGCDDHPMVCITYCDAWAYCRAVGKHLCGRVGGGRLPTEPTIDRSQSQWYIACSNGAAAVQEGCHALQLPETGTKPVGSLSTCQTTAPGYEGIFDLSGNVYEYVDECDPEDPTGNCLARGGHYWSTYSSCTTESTQGDNGSVFFGFRCCAG